MRRDSIFYRLFSQAPALLFELLPHPPENAADYRFDSVAVKEPKFEIDGVFLPPESEAPGTVYFCEVQFQRDERLYERLFAEAFLYFYRHRDSYADWQAVVIYPTRSLEQRQTLPYEDLLQGERVHRVYLAELGEVDALPLGVALMVLTTIAETDAPDVARGLLARSQQEALASEKRRAIIEMVTTIMVYKFITLSRQEVEQMLGIRLQETRVYQEAKAEGEQIGERRGLRKGLRREARSLVLRLLTRRVGALPQTLRSQLTPLSLEQLEALGEALLDFSTLADLELWLQAHQAQIERI